jgi:hypothetical protein
MATGANRNSVYADHTADAAAGKSRKPRRQAHQKPDLAWFIVSPVAEIPNNEEQSACNGGNTNYAG